MTWVRLKAGDDVAALVRATNGESVVVLFDAELDPVELAQARAAIGPLAVERAPVMRVNAVVALAGARGENVQAAARFLDGARSTTGQVLEVSGG